MKVAIIMGGPYRGNQSIIENQLNMIGRHDTYVSCFEQYKEAWYKSNWPLKRIFTTPNLNFKETNWSKYRNDEAGQSGFWQFWNLKNVIENTPSDYDWYIKSRCDLTFQSGQITDYIFTTLDRNTLYCPNNYFDGQSWDYDTLLNDQFYIGDYNTMKTISEFVTEYYKIKRHECNEAIYSNERNLRNFLNERNIVLKILQDVKYTKNHNGVSTPSGMSGFQLEQI
jgi:ribosomal protein S18